VAEWIDLIDPSPDELRGKLPQSIQESALELLLRPAAHDDEPRPTLQAHGDYIFGVFLVAVAVPDEDRVFYQEIDVVTHEMLLSVSKTPPGEHPYDPGPVRESCRPDDNGGMMLYRLIDDIAERYLDLVDSLDAEIDQLEDTVETSPPTVTRGRLSELRQDLLHIRRTLGPTRDAIRRVIDNVVEVRTGPEVFPHDVEVAFNSTYDKLLRAFHGLELSRDLIASVRDYLQGEDRERSERGHEAADGDRVCVAPADVHRRPVRPELPPPLPGARLAVGICVVVGPDRRNNAPPARVLPLEEVALRAMSPHPHPVGGWGETRHPR
jgi:Mg2+ and Co2+ transporter CorA